MRLHQMYNLVTTLKFPKYHITAVWPLQKTKYGENHCEEYCSLYKFVIVLVRKTGGRNY